MARWKFTVPVAAAMVLGGLAWSGMAQTPEDRPRFDPQEMQKRMLERMKTTLGASDEEWKALSPRVEKVMSVSRESSRGGGGFFGGPGGPGGRGGRGGREGRGQRPEGDSAPSTPVAKAAGDLRTALDEKSASAEDISKKLSAYREVRAKAKEELSKAQKELRELLTQRQEATLVLSGMIE